MALPDNYEPKIREKYWQDQWEARGTYAFKDDVPKDQTFVIDTPPPTVSGVLHMEHIFSYTQADFVARFQRMCGKDVFYPMGFDDNGLPTERLVEKINGKKAAQYESREAFVQACHKVVNEAEEEFYRLFTSVALSVDWKLKYQTISKEVTALSQASFLDLIAKGEAYRDFRPTYWDWVDGTAIAQAEIENKELPGSMHDIEFTLEDGSPLVIATTRPELLGACVAVMYHPEDPNADNYKGKHAITPLFGVKVPMIADEAVDKEFGSGVVMCCTFGDDMDKEWWRKHKLPLRALLGKDGKLDFTSALYIESFGGSGAPSYPDLQGLKPKQANTKILELLQAEGKVLKQVTLNHTVKCAERSGTPIEIIPTEQWFVRITDKKEALLKKGEQCNWHPEYMRIRLNQWIEGLKEDWCISRQRFFGVPFPVWYSKRAGEEGKAIYAKPQQLPVDPLADLPEGYSREEVVGDKDVMDTWATSSISPQINAKGINEDVVMRGQQAEPALSDAPGERSSAQRERFTKLFPADLRPQAHEIIRTWAFYTIVKAHLHADMIPWKDLMISGWCLAADKTKMSKSKGNVVTPVALIEDKGADAVRYWASTSRLGADTAFSEDLLKIGKKLVTKMFNAAKFVAPHIQKISQAPTSAAEAIKQGLISETLDLGILSRLYSVVDKATKDFERFEYADARMAMEEFFWKDFCDNYLELVKVRAYGEGNISQAASTSAHLTLYYCLHTLLRLFAPFIPHITEELFSALFETDYKQHGSVHARGMWPNAEDYTVNAEAEVAFALCLELLEMVRKAKSEANVSIKYPVANLTITPADGNLTAERLKRFEGDLKAAGNIEAISLSEQLATPMEGNPHFITKVTLKPQADVA